MGSWVKDLQERVRRASNDVNTVLQPRVLQAKRSIEEGIEQFKGRGKELYADDVSLASSIAALDAVRTHIREISAAVDLQRGQLLAAAQTQRNLGDLLSAPSSVDTPEDRSQANVSFANAQLIVASAFARFALDMSTPMADLSRTFEERYTANVSPLKKQHAAAKTEYLRHARAAAAAASDTTSTANINDPGRRERLESLANNAQPVAQRASEQLQDEIRALLTHATSSLSEWSLNVAQAQAETYTRAAEAFKEPAKLAEKAQDSGL